MAEHEERGNRSGWWNRRRAITAAVFVALFALGLVSTLQRRESELPVYTRGTRRALAGEEVYRVEPKAYTYPPGQLVLFLPFAPLPAEAERTVFYLLNVALLVGALVLVHRMARAVLAERGRTGPGWGFWLIVSVLSARHLTSPLENQSNDLPILFLMTGTAFLRGRGRDVLGGCLAGIATAFKATPLLYAPVLVWQRRWGGALAFGAALVALTLLPDLVAPRPDGRPWALAWYETFVSKVSVARSADAEGAWAAWNVLNQSLSGTLHRLSTDGDGAPWAWDVSIWSPSASALRVSTLAAQLLVLAVVAVAVGPPDVDGDDTADRRMRRWGEVAAVVCGMLLLSPMSSKAHFCVLLLPVGYLVTHLFTRGRGAGAGTALVLAFVLGTLTSRGIVGKELGNAFLARGSVTACALALLLGTARTATLRRRARRDDGAAASPVPDTGLR